MLWSKQYFFFDIDKWLEEHGVDAMRPTAASAQPRVVPHDRGRRDLDARQVGVSVVRRLGPGVPHDRPVDRRSWISPSSSSICCCASVYLHPTGQIPAYEWNFSDVNPPVQAWATIFSLSHGAGAARPDRPRFSQASLRQAHCRISAGGSTARTASGKKSFEGGFLGLDNIGVFDRSAPLPTGGHLEQADGTAWVALFCQNMVEIAFELAAHDPTYEELASNYVMEFLLIARAMNGVGHGRHVGRGGRFLL